MLPPVDTSTEYSLLGATQKLVRSVSPSLEFLPQRQRTGHSHRAGCDPTLPLALPEPSPRSGIRRPPPAPPGGRLVFIEESFLLLGVCWAGL